MAGPRQPSTPLAQLVQERMGDRTLTRLAEAVGMTQGHLSRMLAGAPYSDRARSFGAIAADLGLAPSEVVRVLAGRLVGPDAVFAAQLLLIAAELRVDVGELLPPSPTAEDLEPGHLLERAR